jgi:N12 class adenine-specific DNA methylase
VRLAIKRRTNQTNEENPMTIEHRKTANQSPIPLDRVEMLEAIDEALQEAAQRGLIVDSGKRKWSKRTGRYEIVWNSKIFGH